MPAHVITFKDPFRVMVEFRFWEIESFIQISQLACEEFARTSKRALEEAISKTLKENESLDPLVAIQIASVPEHVTAHYETIPRYLGYSFVIQVYNLFEELGKSLHQELMRRKIIPTSAALSSEDLLERFRAFTKQAGIAFVKHSALRDFKDVRNNIVHRGGNLRGEKEATRKKLRQVVETSSATLKIEAGQLHVAPSYAVKNLNLIKTFFSEALNQMSLRMASRGPGCRSHLEYISTDPKSGSKPEAHAPILKFGIR